MTEVVLGARHAPTTSKIGFVKAPYDAVVAEFEAWQSELGRQTRVDQSDGGLEENVHLLEPLHFATPVKTMIVQTAAGEWSAFVDNGANGSDPTSAVAVLAQRLRVPAFYVTSRESTSHQLASRQIAIYEPNPDATRKVGLMVRTVAVIQEDVKKWKFHQNGDPLPFEDVQQYSARSIVQRLTPSMLADYCAALGVHPFQDDFYPGPSALVSITPTWQQTKEPESFAQARARLGLASA